MGSRFFFSSRRRHTRWPRDWSSDVCSSDLWLQRLVASDGVSEQDWVAEERYQRDGVSADSRTPFTELPPLAQAIGWLVVTHHRLPVIPVVENDIQKTLGARANDFSWN